MKNIWIDTDLSVGMKRHRKEGYCDVDDGFAVLQLLKSPKVTIVGMSSVFGNTTIENADELCHYMNKKFAANELPVHRGAAEGMNLLNVVSNKAVDALKKALLTQKLTIMAIGPATNVGILLLKYPEIKEQIEEVVLVAGRRKPTDYFAIGTQGGRAQDLNFDLDNDAFRVLLESGVKTTLCPYEISSKVWITEEDLDQLRQGDPGNRWIADASVTWLEQWKNQGADGFNPFDVLASHYLISPEDIVFEELNARLEIHPDDVFGDENTTIFKQYLLCDKSEKGYPVRYCHDVVPDYHAKLMDSLF